MFTGVQEAGIVNLVLENNEIRLREIQSHIIQDNTLFNNIQRVSLSTLARILKRNQIRMKQLYKVPFERNSQRNKELRQAYVDVSTILTAVHHTQHCFPVYWITPYWLIFVLCFQGVLEMDAHAIPHEFIFIDEAGFNLAKTRRRGRNVIGHRAIIDVPGQRGGNITMCAAISSMHGVLHRHANLGPYNTGHILSHAIPPTILTISEPHRRVLFGMAVEGIRPAALCAHASCAGHGRGMWWDWRGCNSGMDKALKALLPSMSGKGRYCLWCWRGVVARPGCAARCCLIIFLASFFYCNIFFLKFSFSVYCFL